MEEELRRLFDAPAFTKLNTLAVVLGCLSLVSAIGFIVCTFANKSPLGSGEFIAPFTLIFPLWGWMLVVLWQRGLMQRGRSMLRSKVENWQIYFSEVPAPARVLLPFVIVLALIGVLTSFPGLRGQPEYDAARHDWYLTSHAVRTYVSHSTYIHAVALGNRAFLCGAVFFTAIATSIAWGERHRRQHIPTGVWPLPRVPRPWWIPTIGIASSMLTIGLAGSGLFGGIIVTHLTTYWNQAPHLPATGLASVALTPGAYDIFVACSGDRSCPAPPQVEVTGPNGPEQLDTFLDPSNDHLSFGAQPYVGEVSFTVSSQGMYLVQTRSIGNLKLRLIHSESQEAIALAGWIIGGAISVLLVFFGAAACVDWYVWRHRAPRV